MHLVCQVSAPIVANIATFELPGRLSYFYLASLLGIGEFSLKRVLSTRSRPGWRPRMRIELARPDDEAQVKKLLAECELPSQDITSAHLKHFWVLRDGPRLAGVIGLELLDNVALLRSLAVPVSYRGRGFGSQLTQAAEAYARSCHVEALYLLTTTAWAFFAKHGYARIERDAAPSALHETAEFRSLCPSSAVCMSKHLT
jgi:amino-acid N-acetyltransferase